MGSASASDAPEFVSAAFNAPASRWSLTFTKPIVSIPSPPTFGNWILDPAGAALSPTIITLGPGLVRLINPAFTGAETIVQYTHTPGDDYDDADAQSVASFVGSL